MYPRIAILFLFILIIKTNTYSQCTGLGQLPGSAFPVCGTTVFKQDSVPICVNQKIPTNCPAIPNIIIRDKNPYWYKFTCYKTGTLGFTISPIDVKDDYDWQIFDITGRNPFEVYNDPTLIVTYNWSGNPGLTGATGSGGTELFNCWGNEYPKFNDMPTLIQGHDYLMMVSHFDDTQSGYQLTFTGGTAILADAAQPKLKSATTNCDGSVITLNLTKKILCSSIAPDGSDFIIPGASIASVINVGCLSGFDVDEIKLKISSPLPPGNYTVTIRNGTDGNTLLANCDVSVPVGDNTGFTVLPLRPTPMDSVSYIKCKPFLFNLVFSSPIKCNSIAKNGSDFTITGPSTVNVIAAIGACGSDSLVSSIILNLASPILSKGLYQINVKTGSDGNTLINECNQETLPSSLNFTVFDSVSTVLSYQVKSGCRFDTIQFSGPSGNGINKWSWTLNGNVFSTQQNPTKLFPATGQFEVSVSVSNAVCSDSSSTTIVLNDEVKADFEVTNTMCPEDTAFFKNLSTGKISSWLWNFGNGITSTQQTPPPQTYPPKRTETNYNVLLTAFGNNGCADTVTKKIRVLQSCFIGTPNAFSPNGDGLNDFFYPLNGFKTTNFDFRVYNIWGQLVFNTIDWKKTWDGKVKGIPQPVGIYVWTLKYTHLDSGKKYSLKGTVMLIR